MRIDDYSCKFFTNSNTLSSFLGDVRKYTVPTPEEETELIVRYKDGDIEAGNELICRNLRFIYSLAKIYAKDEEEVVDYVNEGVIGFMTALRDFNVTLGYRFITYAVWYVRRSMNFYLMDTKNAIKRTNNNKIGKKIDIIKQKHYAENGRMPSASEIREILEKEYNISIKKDSDVYDVDMVSISEEVEEDYTVEENSKFTSETASFNEYENTIDSDYQKEMVKAIFSSLPQKYSEMLKMLYGIDEEREYTTEEVANKLGIKPSEVVKMRNKAFKYIQENCEVLKKRAI